MSYLYRGSCVSFIKPAEVNSKYVTYTRTYFTVFIEYRDTDVSSPLREISHFTAGYVETSRYFNQKICS